LQNTYSLFVDLPTQTDSSSEKANIYVFSTYEGRKNKYVEDFMGK